ncbi:MAG TPA: 3-hydroxyacyl-CoA dehydrogenase family protein [Candidatus Polarisedimenticolaceae bacterium]|nr:3-hydroxyacyl-CoA dehydrogenase family protein [Candidatus Polarisedimenticolaceae bacterium]
MPPLERVTVVGLGTMGQGIAQVSAAAGCAVRVHDVSSDALERGMRGIRGALDVGVDKGKLTAEQRRETLERIAPADTLEAAVEGAELAIEAVPESLELKSAVFARLDRAAPPRALLASNTSSLSITALAAATGRPERVLGMHFFNPVHLMPLVELVRGERTAATTLDEALEFARRIGKEPIVVRDSPGFASSRLGLALGLEAMRMLEQGVASAEDIDKAMTLGYRHPMGPLRLTDLVGLDVRLAIAEHLHAELRSETFRPPEILRRLVAEGRLGKKSGRGFYAW